MNYADIPLGTELREAVREAAAEHFANKIDDKVSEFAMIAVSYLALMTYSRRWGTVESTAYCMALAARFGAAAVVARVVKQKVLDDFNSLKAEFLEVPE